MQDLCTKSCNVTAIVLCAGAGSRANLGYNKVLHDISGVSIARRSVEKFTRFNQVIVVCSSVDKEVLRSQLPYPNIKFVYGGNTRSQSVRNALSAIESTDIVLIHDGARPFVSDEIISNCVYSALNTGSGVTAVKSINAVKINIDGKIKTVNRDEVFTVQTPQAFKFELIKSAFDTVSGDYADDSEVFELAGYPVTIVNGDYANRKLTTPADFMGLSDDYKIGFGFDVHAFAPNRDLILCGVKIEHSLGLLGHSDADAPVHALMDAMLSCAGLADIGVHFPDTDDRYKGISSMELLKRVVELTKDFKLINASLCIIAQKPKLAPHIQNMRQNLSTALGIDIDNINISATTSELLGITGEGKGLAVSADILMKKL
ncbi:MAG: 2-C-methyl-D-erythritol 2,4-cyclodiphosphate synthase [Clostridia bacterium]|nr:2-C-methyl-D-erythritol 2,4-cyclodiphosphate synthase [Clostridia bacterium]